MDEDFTSRSVSFEHYLETVYQPDRDWISGELRERNVGQSSHVKVQNFLMQTFRSHSIEWQIRALSEQRVQTSRDEVLVADLCVVSRALPLESIVRTAPLLCVEILSREDKMSEVQLRVERYLGLGASAVWVIDPRRRDAYLARSGRVMERHWERLTVPSTPITIAIAELFSEIDEPDGKRD